MLTKYNVSEIQYNICTNLPSSQTLRSCFSFVADLSKNRFGELPVEVTEFYFLERLLLYHNTIRSIPDSVVYLQSLIYLDLR
jgi:Leucine-rich repeat (LRR) protein